MQMFFAGGIPVTAIIVLLFVQWRYLRNTASRQAMAMEAMTLASSTTNYEPSYRKELNELVERMNKRKKNV